MFRKLAEWVVQARIKLVAATLLLACVALVALPSLRFDFSAEAFQASGASDYAEDFKAAFGYEDTLLVMVLDAEGAMPERDALSPEALTWQFDTAKALVTLDGVTDVDTLTTLGLPRKDPEEFGAIDTRPLIQASPVAEADAARVREVVKASPWVQGQLVSRDGRLAVLAVYIDPARREIGQLTEVIDAVEAHTKANPPPKGYAMRLSGLTELRRNIVRDLRKDALTMAPLTGLVYTLVLLVLFRRMSGTLVPLSCVGLSVAFTLGTMAWLGAEINLVNNTLPLLLFVIGISDSIHLISRYAEESRAGHDPKHLITTVEHLGLACLLTSATTAVGFASLVVADNPLLRGFGWQASLGVALAYLVTIFFMPSVLTWLKPPAFRGAPEEAGADGAFERTMDRCAAFVARRAWPILAVGLVVLSASAWLSARMEIDSYLMENYPADHPVSENIRLVERELGGFIPFEVSLHLDDPDALQTPEVYRAIAQVERWALDQPEILWARSYTDIHQEMRAIFLGDPAQREILPPPDAKGKAQIYQIQELIDTSREALGYTTYVTPDRKRARLLLRIGDLGSKRTMALAERVRAELDRAFPPGSGVTAKLTGDGYLVASSIDGFIRDLFLSLLGAGLVIFVMMALLFRSLRIGLIATLPNAIPLILTFGYMAVRGYPLNMANIIIFSISLGLAVDDTIHVITRFREELGRRATLDEAMRWTFRGAGRAILLTTALLLAGMGVLMTSSFVPTQRFAELTSITLLSAVVGDLILLPALVHVFWKHAPSEATDSSATP